MQKNNYKNTFISLFDCCKVTVGYNRSIIVDLQRKKYYFIPNALAELLGNGSFSYNTIEESHKYDIKFIEDYISFLAKNEIIYISDTKLDNNLIASPQKNEEPFEITNIILDCNGDKRYNLEAAFSEIANIGIPNVQIRCFSELDLDLVSTSLQPLNHSCTRNIEIIAKYPKNLTDAQIDSFIDANDGVLLLVLFSAPDESVRKHGDRTYGFTVHTTQEINSSLHCGIVSPSYFAPNTKMYYDGLNGNSCLNKKIAIDVDGNIKNCPSQAKSFGNINSISILDAMSDIGFKSLWTITKDRIHVCKDCEFRMICTDCRAYIDNPEDIYSKPLKCGYNPYSSEWQDWEKMQDKQRSIAFYEAGV